MDRNPLKLRIEIEAMCRKAGIGYRDVSYIAVRPMTVTFFYHDRPIQADENGDPVEHVKVLPYVWEEDILGDQEGGREARRLP